MRQELRVAAAGLAVVLCASGGLAATPARGPALDPALRALARPGGEGAGVDLARRLAAGGARGAGLRLPVVLQRSPGTGTPTGLEITSCVGDICGGWLAPERASAVVSSGAVRRLEIARRLYATAAAVPVQPAGETRVPELAARSGGAGVVVAFVDTGVDIFHADFRHGDGTTRIKALLDLSVPGDVDGDGTLDGAGPAGGTEWDEAAIDAALVAGSFPSSDPTGHGTHGLSVAAGDDGLFPGVAPAADLVVVKATREVDSLAFEAVDLVAALAWVEEQCAELGLPCVVNLSLGSDFASHDGRSLEEAAIDQMSGPGIAGRAVVVAAGNSAGHQASVTPHAQGLLRAGLPSEHEVVIPAYTPHGGAQTDRLLVDLWYDGDATAAVEVESPTGVVVRAELGGVAVEATAEGSVVIVNDGVPSAGSGDVEALVLVDDWDGVEVAAGSWKVRLVGERVHGQARYDLWVVDATELGDLPQRPSVGGGDALSLIGKPGSAFTAITVGSHALHEPGSRYLTSWVDVSGVPRADGTAEDGALSDFSSTGPTRDGRIKPELTAPGERVMGAVSGDAYPTGDPGEVSLYKYHEWYPAEPTALLTDDTPGAAFGMLQGTSFAAPVVTGLAARVLELHPGWDGEQVRNALVTSAVQDAHTGGDPGGLWGYGKAELELGNGVAVPGALRVATPSLPVGRQDRGYRGHLAATGGERPYTWSQVGGTLPSGLAVDPLGSVEGTPTEAGLFTVTVGVTDDTGASAQRELGLEIRGEDELEILTESLPAGAVRRDYRASLEASGGVQPYSWSVAAGALPGGLTLDADGLVGGAPTTAGEACLTVQLEDGAAATEQRSYCIWVDAFEHVDWGQRGLIGGTVTALAIDPANPDRLFAGTEGNGLYVSSDRGGRWVRAEGGPRVTITEIVFSWDDPSTIYVGTDDDGLHASTDGGATWAKLTAPDYAPIYFVHVDLANPDWLYCGTIGSWYSSTDRGATWVERTTPWQCMLQGARYFDLAQDPTDTDTLYLSTHDYIEDYGCVWFSTDHGATWDWSPLGLPPDRHWICGQIPGSQPFERILLDPHEPQIVYGNTSSCSLSYGCWLYLSADGAHTWTSVWLPGTPVASTQKLRALVAAPSTGALFVGGDAVYRSTDHLASHEDVSTGRPGWTASTVYALAVDPLDEGVVYAGTDRGVLLTEDGGATWHSRSNGVFAADVVDGDLRGDRVLVVTVEGVFETEVGGSFWSRIEPPFPLTRIRYVSSPDPGAFVAADSRHVWLYAPSEASFVDIGASIPVATGSADWIEDLAVERLETHDRVFCLTSVVGSTSDVLLGYWTDDLGGSWAQFEAPVAACHPGMSGHRVFPAGDVLFTTCEKDTAPGRLHRSTDLGSSWAQIDLPPETAALVRVNGLWRRSGDASLWLTAHLGYYTGIAQTAILRSDDDGASFAYRWISDDSDGFGDFIDLVFRPAEPAEIIAAPVDLRDYWGNLKDSANGPIASVSDFEGGPSVWDVPHERRAAGLPPLTQVPRLLYHDGKDVLVAGTVGSGVHTSWDGGVSWQEANTFSSIASSITDVVTIADHTIVLGSRGYGSYSSTDGGGSFSPNNAGLAGGFDVRSLALDEDGVLWAATGGGVFSQAAVGGAWTRSSLVDAATDIVVDGSGAARRIWVTVAGQGVASSSDGGTTWAVSAEGLATLDLESLEVETLASARRIWVTGLGGDGVYVSGDDGASWSAVWGIGLGSRDVYDLGLEEGAARRIWVTTADGVYVSGDDGRTWGDASAGLPRQVPATSITFDPVSGEALVGVNDPGLGGVYRGGNLTGMWRPFNGGLEDRRVNRVVRGASVASGGETRTVFHAGTDGGGLYSTVVAAGSATEPLAVTTAALAEGGLRAPYSVQLAASGGEPPYTWGLVGGQLPAGLELTPTGLLHGRPAEAGVWQVTLRVVDGLSATAERTLTLVVHGRPEPRIAGAGVVCAGSTVELDAGAGYAAYLWSTGETSRSITVAPLVDTTYGVTVTDAFGNLGRDEHAVAVVPEPTPAISGPTEVCAGSGATLDAGSGYASYLWSPGGETTQSIVVSPAVTTAYGVTVTTGEGCSGASPSHTVTVNPLPQPGVSGPCYVLPGETATLDAGPGYEGYLWSTDGTGQTVQVSPPVTTTYTVTVTDANGCEGSASFTVVVWDASVVFADCFESGTTGAWTFTLP